MAIAIAVAAFLFFDFCFVWVLIGSCVAPIRALGAQFPAQSPAADAVRKEFQSFKFGLLDAGWGIHVAVDDRFLHLSPARLERWFRIPPMSVPWDKVHLIKSGPRRTKVRIEGDKERLEIRGPTWCLGLAGARGPVSAAPPN